MDKIREPLPSEAIARVASWFTDGRVHWRLQCQALLDTCAEIRVRNGTEDLIMFLGLLRR